MAGCSLALARTASALAIAAWLLLAVGPGSAPARQPPRPSYLVPPTWPFAPSPDQRAPDASDGLPPFWADGLPCSTGCRPRGAISGWPLRPFHSQHAVRAGINELRSSSFHHPIDIQARDRVRVYAIQPGRAHIIMAHGPEERVQVGNFIYWHVKLRVHEGQVVRPFRTVLGTTLRTFGHLALAEVDGNSRYLNPLRPGGRMLSPWRDDAPPVLGPPRFLSRGRVHIEAFDPQSFNVRTGYETPVLAPAALAYRLFDARGRPLGPLHFALRGSHNLDWSVHRQVFAPGAHKVPFLCWVLKVFCRPRWDYVLAGGLAPPLPHLPPGRYRLTAYAWDWADNRSARDTWFTRAGGASTVSSSPGSSAPAVAPQPWRPTTPGIARARRSDTG